MVVSLNSRLESNKEEEEDKSEQALAHHVDVIPSEYRGTSIIRNSAPLAPYSRNMPRALWQP